MTIDTEGSELELVLDFPWNDFDVRVVQVEQLSEIKYSSQKGRKDAIIRHLEQYEYKLLSVYEVEPDDTDDLILTRHVDKSWRKPCRTLVTEITTNVKVVVLNSHNSNPSRTMWYAWSNKSDNNWIKILEMSIDKADPQVILQRRKFLANEALKARKRKNHRT